MSGYWRVAVRMCLGKGVGGINYLMIFVPLAHRRYILKEELSKKSVSEIKTNS